MSETEPDIFDIAPAGQPRSHLVLILCGILVTAFGIWAAVSTLDIVSTAQGEVLPASKVKIIQHLEGGIVSEILVKEGAKVATDQPLLVLEPTASGADVGELHLRMAVLRVDVARIEALNRGLKKPAFPSDIAADRPDLVVQALERFKAQRQRHETELRKQREAITQRQQEIGEITTRIGNTRNSLKILGEQVTISEDLLESKLTSRFQHLELLREAGRLEGLIKEDGAALRRAQAALAEARATMENIKAALQEENQSELQKARLELGELSQRAHKFEDSLERTVVRSPVPGIVKTLNVATIGGVVRPGEAVAEIVPLEDRLVIEARLSTHDIGYVRAGQQAKVKLASAEAARFGSLTGQVINVSPDTLVTQDGMPFYKVRIETESSYFEHGSLRYDLFPGVQVVADIQTGQRTVMEYLLAPLTGYVDEALHER